MEIYHPINDLKSPFMAPLTFHPKTKFPTMYLTIYALNENFEYSFSLINDNIDDIECLFRGMKKSQ